MIDLEKAMMEWRYLICLSGQPAWEDFEPDYIEDFRCLAHLSASSVAKQIAAHAELDDDEVLLCLENDRGERFEVPVHGETVCTYVAGYAKQVRKATTG